MRLLSFLILYFFSSIATLSAQPNVKSAGYPRLYFDYHVGFDYFHCSSVPNGTLPNEWVQEAASQLKNFQKLWDVEGEPLLKRLVELTQKRFKRSEETAFLMLCPDKPGMARPLLLQYSWYLSKPSKDMGFKKFSRESFVSYVFHEILHTYLKDLKLNSLDHTGKPVKSLPTLLLKKFENETPNVLDHLHVSAMMKVVLKDLKKEKILRETMEFEVKDPSMKRVWEIINDPNGPGELGFFKEIKTALP